MPDCEDSIGIIPGRRQATRRLANAMVRVLGGAEVTLRLADPSSGDTSSQLGITPPTSSDITIAPALVEVDTSSGAPHIEAIFGHKVVQPIAETYGVTDIAGWLVGAQGVVYRGELFPITHVASQQFGGGDYLYMLTAKG